MPLFFIIAIGAGAFTMGAVTVDATSDMRQQGEGSSPKVSQATGFQPGAYPTLQECVNAAAARGLAASACQRS
jgi:hypothetical protein